MPNQHRMQPTEEQLRRMLELRAQGVSKKRIGVELGVSEWLITRWMDEHYGVVTPKGVTKYGKAGARKHGGIYFDCTCMVDVLKGESHG